LPVWAIAILMKKMLARRSTTFSVLEHYRCGIFTKTDECVIRGSVEHEEKSIDDASIRSRVDTPFAL